MQSVASGTPLEKGGAVKSQTMCLFLAQVLFCYEQFDELTLLHLREFDKKKLISVETDIVVDHYKEEKFEENRPGMVGFPCPVPCMQCCCPVSCSEGTPHSAHLQFLTI